MRADSFLTCATYSVPTALLVSPRLSPSIMVILQSYPPSALGLEEEGVKSLILLLNIS